MVAIDKGSMYFYKLSIDSAIWHYNLKLIYLQEKIKNWLNHLYDNTYLIKSQILINRALILKHKLFFYI